MRRVLACVVLALASVALAPVPTAIADDPEPTVVLGPAPRIGVDATIRAAGSSQYVGQDRYGGGQRIEQRIGRLERAVSFVRICSNVSGRIRLEGTPGGRGFRVKYLVGRHDVTDEVVAGSYRIRRQRACAGEVRMVVRWRSGSSDTARTFSLRATPPSGVRDSVSTHVTVV